MSASSRRPEIDPGQKPDQGKKRLGHTERLVVLTRILIDERKITKARLFDVLGVKSQSSFKRYKQSLKSVGYELTYDGKSKCYRVKGSGAPARYGVDPRARGRLANVRTAVANLGGSAARALAEQLDALDAVMALDDPDSKAFVSSRNPEPRGGGQFYETLDRALTALSEHRWLTFRYRRSGANGSADTRTVAPYAVHAHNGRYYLWGPVEGETQPKLYALDRIGDAAIEEDEFVPEEGLTLEDSLRYSFGIMLGEGPPQRVEIRIEPSAAAYVTCRRWPAEVESAVEADGSVRMAFEVTRFEELVAWVLSFGGAATILSPPEARARLQDAVDRMRASIEAPEATRANRLAEER